MTSSAYYSMEYNNMEDNTVYSMDAGVLYQLYH